jgi:phosphoribosylcarboxyaminoimidazole (NCAIR) mutase
MKGTTSFVITKAVCADVSGLAPHSTGGAAHLPGMTAAMTPLPVIGVPVKPAGCSLDGVDALLSICQMPKGVPVSDVWYSTQKADGIEVVCKKCDVLSICLMPKGEPVSGVWEPLRCVLKLRGKCAVLYIC